MFVSLHCLKSVCRLMEWLGVIRLKSRNMNRIILIGNGFDLAHGLKTSYADFIDWYWGEWGKRLRQSHSKKEDDGLCSFVLKDDIKLHSWG